jgi:hypothetical protein
MSKRDKFCIKIIAIIYGIPVLLMLGSLSLPIVFGQGTPTTTIQGTGTGNFQFLPQQAYVVPLPPPGVQQQSNGFNMGGEGGIVGMITGALGIGTAIYSKLTGDKKTDALAEKDKALAIENEKRANVQYSLAKQQYEANPDYAAKLEGTAPDTKLAKLQADKELAAKVTADAGTTKPPTTTATKA